MKTKNTKNQNDIQQQVLYDLFQLKIVVSLYVRPYVNAKINSSFQKKKAACPRNSVTPLRWSYTAE